MQSWRCEEISIPSSCTCWRLTRLIAFCSSWRGKHTLVFGNSLLNCVVFSGYCFYFGPSRYKYARGFPLILCVLIFSVHGMLNSGACLRTDARGGEGPRNVDRVFRGAL